MKKTNKKDSLKPMFTDTEQSAVKKKNQKATDILLFKASRPFLKLGEIVESEVIASGAKTIFVDLSPFGVGVITGQEFLNGREIIKKLGVGDKIKAKIIKSENEGGYIELSLKEADKDLVWREAEELKRKRSPLDTKVTGANKGGLILEWKGLAGFLPTSRLIKEHYPKVEIGEEEKISQELKKFIGKTFKAAIIDVDQKQEKLIFSEKELQLDELRKKIANRKVGEIIEGRITRVMEFGIFIEIEPELEGLIHISQLDWGIIDDPQKIFKPGQTIKAKIIEIANDKISLSLKVLKPDPWQDIEKKYKKGDILKGVVIKINKYGCFVSVEEGIAGLAHFSEFGAEEIMRRKIEIGKAYLFQILLIDASKGKLILNYIEEGK